MTIFSTQPVAGLAVVLPLPGWTVAGSKASWYLSAAGKVGTWYMLNVDKKTAAQIIDAIAIAIDGKPASAKTFEPSPFSGLSDYGDWGQEKNDATQDTSRTIALFLSYLIFSGGRIPLVGIQMQDTWFRPDVWVAGALVKRGHLVVDELAGDFVVTSKGWSLIATALEKLAV